jgi:uncharacterized membrane protein
MQAIFVRSHPFEAARAVMNGTVYAAEDFAHRGVYVVGWNDLLPHHGAAAALTVCLAVMMLFAPACPVRSWLARGLLAVSLAAPIIGISVAEYIIWTPPGGHTVFGIQPRYWLPLIPLLTLLVQGTVGGWSKTTAGRWLLLVASVVFAMIACTLPWMASYAFYGEGLSRVLALNLR